MLIHLTSEELKKSVVYPSYSALETSLGGLATICFLTMREPCQCPPDPWDLIHTKKSEEPLHGKAEFKPFPSLGLGYIPILHDHSV